MIRTEHPRDLVMIGAIFGFAAVVWSGWAQSNPPGDVWRIVLGVLALVGLVVFVLSAILAAKNWHSGSALSAKGKAFTTYMIVFWIEFVGAIAGGIALSVTGRTEYVAPLVLLIVGVHFFPLAGVFQQPIFTVVAVLLTIGAIVAAVMPFGDRSFWCGIIAAPILLATAILCLVAGRRALADRKSPRTM